MPAGIGDFERAPARQGHARLRAGRRLVEADGHARLHILAARRRRGARAPASGSAAEKLAEYVVGLETRRARARAPAAEIELESFKARPRPGMRPAARAGPVGEALKTGVTRLAFGVDLAAIESGALFFVTENFIGRADLGEFLFRFQLLALIGMKFLRELAKSGFDLGRARGFCDAENNVRITHRLSPLPRSPKFAQERESPK